MRNLSLAVAAAAMAVPAAVAFPTSGAEAHRVNGSTNHRHCRRSNGTTGMIVGGAGGALAGRAIAGRNHRTTGTIVGAAAGALVGREVARSRTRCR
jgi:uncharacterized protein YcfJ